MVLIYWRWDYLSAHSCSSAPNISPLKPFNTTRAVLQFLIATRAHVLASSVKTSILTVNILSPLALSPILAHGVNGGAGFSNHVSNDVCFGVYCLLIANQEITSCYELIWIPGLGVSEFCRGTCIVSHCKLAIWEWSGPTIMSFYPLLPCLIVRLCLRHKCKCPGLRPTTKERTNTSKNVH